MDINNYYEINGKNRKIKIKNRLDLKLLSKISNDKLVYELDVSVKIDKDVNDLIDKLKINTKEKNNYAARVFAKVMIKDFKEIRQDNMERKLKILEEVKKREIYKDYN